MVFVVKCLECKETELCACEKTVNRFCVATEKKNVDFTHVYCCSACLTEKDSKGKGATPSAHIFLWSRKKRRKNQKKLTEKDMVA